MLDKKKVEELISEVRYFTTHSEQFFGDDGQTMICVIKTKSGFESIGQSGTISPRDNWNEELGKSMAYDRAFNDLWAKEAYAYQSRVISQEEMWKVYAPLIKRARLFLKVRPVYAKLVTRTEDIVTVTSSGVESKNTAIAGDYIVRNSTEAGERYVLKPEKFLSRYILTEETLPGGWVKWMPTGKVWAVEYQGPEIRFMASYGQPTVCRNGDMIACAPGDEGVYRIDRKEFFETYRAVEAAGHVSEKHD